MINTDMPNKVHEGRNIKRFREMLGIKQDTLAFELGEDWTQKKISLLEQKETIEPDILEQVAKILKVTPEAIKSFSEEAAVNIISNTFTDFKDNASGINYNCDLTFNPIDKVIELYERLLAIEKEKNELLQGKQKK
ncbi:helix-turn-helix transcriptional regulator [Chitinophaga sp. LS1]|uniref:helix-turn-helix domain-containing protein n=1 Tax=Chitinophaga sp. LS1 TaxID=3051176 RepID=UPI002AAC3B26|nr:helix-turn-helix transcriptional regulator [Chitinophaga sp. LS1]WPV65962.1 helix-turn-helix transcriptional regulator [Chitinophaga sp. LS1]